MKKKLAALMAIAVLSMSSVYAAETQGPVSRWLDNLTGKVVRLASREDIDLPVEEHLIVELYSK